jgi:hypothetical protein
MATLTLAQIKQYNPNWAGRNQTPGKQFSIRSTDNKYWNFTYQSGEGENAVYTFEKSDKPFPPLPDATDEQMTKEIAAGTYGEGEDRSLALARSIWAQGTDRGGQVQQAVNTIYTDPAALEALGSGSGTQQPVTTQLPAVATTQTADEKPAADPAATGQAAATQQPAAAAATTEFDPNNPRLQQYIQRIVYGKNLQGFYSERNVKKAYQELVARRYTPEQALAAIEAFNKSFSSSDGGSYGMDRNMRAAMQSRNQMLAGETADLRTAAAARQLTQPPADPTAAPPPADPAAAPSADPAAAPPADPAAAANRRNTMTPGDSTKLTQYVLDLQKGIADKTTFADLLRVFKREPNVAGFRGEEGSIQANVNNARLAAIKMIQDAQMDYNRKKVAGSNVDESGEVNALKTRLASHIQTAAQHVQQEAFVAPSIPPYSKGGYVTRPKKSVVNALKQWKFGT